MPRVLIADDSEAARRALRNLIHGNGWEVCGEAENGLAAVEKAAAMKPDLVILDFRMPNLNGLEAGQIIHAADPNMPLLLFTLDNVDTRLQELARAAGFVALSQNVKVYSPFPKRSKFCFRVRLSLFRHRN